MGALDELRRSIERQLTWRRAGDEMFYADDVRNALDAFEAAHPGLVDHTHQCAKCGAPIGTMCHTASGLFDDRELFVSVFADDHDAYDRLYCIEFCDTCYDEMKAQEWHADDVQPLVERYDA